MGSLAKQQVNIAEVSYKLIAKNLSVGKGFVKRSFRIGRFRAYNGSKVDNIILYFLSAILIVSSLSDRMTAMQD